MCKIVTIPSEVADDETLARILFSPSMMMNNVISPTAFNLRDTPKETYVSIFRKDYIVLSKDSISIKAKPEDVLFGYASLNAGICQNLSYGDITTSVKSHSSKNNPTHAGIHYSKFSKAIKGACKDVEFLLITKMLANSSKLIVF